MKSITTMDVRDRRNDEAKRVLFWHTDDDCITKSLEYNYITEEYTIHTRKGVFTTKDMVRATDIYNIDACVS